MIVRDRHWGWMALMHRIFWDCVLYMLGIRKRKTRRVDNDLPVTESYAPCKTTHRLAAIVISHVSSCITPPWPHMRTSGKPKSRHQSQ